MHNVTLRILNDMCVLPEYPDWVRSLVWKYPQNTFSDEAELGVDLWFQRESQAFHHLTERRTCKIDHDKNVNIATYNKTNWSKIAENFWLFVYRGKKSRFFSK